jgi:hypothetical protein
MKKSVLDMTYCDMSAGIAEPEKTPTAKQRLCKHIPAAMNMRTTVEEVMENSYFYKSALTGPNVSF